MWRRGKVSQVCVRDSQLVVAFELDIFVHERHPRPSLIS